ncbi:diacylglycerol kinase family protein [Novosphingobium sp. TH158]|uniref:diacylglycerol/lipid kinase family protein n=1 Tax=Novosphingobium sp. TH158 TaxID=2067455 RepID=UPI000C7C1DD6|nr:diacylglycerol kinase family protein [Novosphingobium sp. TH158]PLK25951.1 sphingosine kinase [Novosphingobium sp. TH158]
MERRIVLLNCEAGAFGSDASQFTRQLVDGFAANGCRAEIHLLDGRQVCAAAAYHATTTRRLVIGGGDGTIAAAAQAIGGRQCELAILPLGTRNHFARDLGLPTSLDEAIRLAVRGRARPVDLGRVNDAVFVNNVSIGSYALMVRQRDSWQHRTGLPKWLATIPASGQVLARLRFHRLRIATERPGDPVVTPLLFVGNNRYSLERAALGSRSALSDGQLAVYAVARRSRIALLWFGLRTLFGRADLARDFVLVEECSQLTVGSHASHVEAALDGEIRRLRYPLRFESMAGALQVVAP